MRQFDVFVFEEDSPEFHRWKPEFEDPALGWFHTHKWNGDLEKLEAEWVVFTTPDVKIDRDFLNELAQDTENFGQCDAFAPRVKHNGTFYGGLITNGGRGFEQIDENAPMRFVAGPNSQIAVFSRRIIQRTGFFDLDLPPELRLLDYALRMAHAGGRMFSIPYLVANSYEQAKNSPAFDSKQNIRAQWEIIYKSLYAKDILDYSLRHPSTMPLWFHKKLLKLKRDKATDLSKLTPSHLLNISKNAPSKIRF